MTAGNLRGEGLILPLVPPYEGGTSIPEKGVLERCYWLERGSRGEEFIFSKSIATRPENDVKYQEI